MRRFLILLFAVCALSSAHAVVEHSIEINSLQMHEFKILGVGWNRVVKVHYNPANIPNGIFGNHPRLDGLSPELREEMTHVMVEEIIVEHLNQLSAVENSSFIGVYGGRTNETCEKTSVNIPICWGDDKTDSYRGLTTINFVYSAVSPERVPKFAKVEFVREKLAPLSYAEISYIVLHELVHLAGFDHTTEDVDSIMNLKRNHTSTTLFQNDIDGMKELYRIKESCASNIEMQNGVPSFIVQIFYEGELHKARFAYRNKDGVESLEIREFFTPSENTRCTLKLNGDSLHIQFLRLNESLYWLDMQVTPRGIEITGFGPVS